MARENAVYKPGFIHTKWTCSKTPVCLFQMTLKWFLEWEKREWEAWQWEFCWLYMSYSVRGSRPTMVPINRNELSMIVIAYMHCNPWIPILHVSIVDFDDYVSLSFILSLYLSVCLSHITPVCCRSASVSAAFLLCWPPDWTATNTYTHTASLSHGEKHDS